jgi:hypothetical protein
MALRRNREGRVGGGRESWQGAGYDESRMVCDKWVVNGGRENAQAESSTATMLGTKLIGWEYCPSRLTCTGDGVQGWEFKTTTIN